MSRARQQMKQMVLAHPQVVSQVRWVWGKLTCFQIVCFASFLTSLYAVPNARLALLCGQPRCSSLSNVNIQSSGLHWLLKRRISLGIKQSPRTDEAKLSQGISTTLQAIFTAVFFWKFRSLPPSSGWPAHWTSRMILPCTDQKPRLVSLNALWR